MTTRRQFIGYLATAPLLAACAGKTPPPCPQFDAAGAERLIGFAKSHFSVVPGLTASDLPRTQLFAAINPLLKAVHDRPGIDDNALLSRIRERCGRDARDGFYASSGTLMLTRTELLLMLLASGAMDVKALSSACALD